ncbi:MAG TPA: choice-of-anchor R domain-containing protein [Verrucomicrobiae bacterium]|nr:choice-of-anchor R domain-containing protein [Verrucomicrobiae bacterium]
MQPLIQKIFSLAVTWLAATAACAQTYSIDTFTVSGGSDTVSSGAYTISGTVGQPDGNLALSGGAFSMFGGFWSVVDGATPQVMTTIIFDNTGGSENGYEAAATNAWLANKFCLGPQPYQLDSVTVLLVSAGIPGLRTVRLQLYANDPVSGKPSVSTGVIMNLSGITNPITLPAGFAETPIKWVPATPFTLAANTCYWVVLSTDGGLVGEVDSASAPTGDAGANGRTLSADAGASWQQPDTGTNRKMLIQGTPMGSPLPIAELAVGGSTAIPGGTGNFTSLPLAPGLSGSNLVFYGTGSSGQQGIYQTTRGLNQAPARIADLNTAIPNGAGNFSSFGTQAGIIIVGGDILFSGGGAGSQQGIYFSSHSTPGSLVRIADTSTAIPGGTGNFAAFQNAPDFSGSGAAFVGSGAGGQQGIYTVAVITPPQVGSPLRIADTITAIPGGNGSFTSFPSGPALSGSEVAFIGNGSGAQQGLYTVAVITPPQVGSPLRIADTSTAIPGGSGNFTAFGSDQAHPVDPAMRGNRLAFVGSGSGGQQGVYNVAVMAPPLVGSPLRVADTSTPVPGGDGNFTSFGAVSVSATDLAFLGQGTGGQTGIYDMTAGQLLKVVAVGDRIGSKTIAGLNFSRSGLSGDPIAFQATFSDGSQGVYTIDVPAPLSITAAERIGSDLRLSFNSVAGQNYAIQSSADLSSGNWTTLPGAPTPGVGGTVVVTLTNALGQPQQFYRVKIVP